MTTPKSIARFIEDPDADLDYTISWAPWLSTGETITTHTVEVDEVNSTDTELTIHDVSGSDDAVTFWAKLGTDDGDYYVTHHIETSAGRKDDRSITILCRQR